MRPPPDPKPPDLRWIGVMVLLAVLFWILIGIVLLPTLTKAVI